MTKPKNRPRRHRGQPGLARRGQSSTTCDRDRSGRPAGAGRAGPTSPRPSWPVGPAALRGSRATRGRERAPGPDPAVRSISAVCSRHEPHVECRRSGRGRSPHSPWRSARAVDLRVASPRRGPRRSRRRLRPAAPRPSRDQVKHPVHDFLFTYYSHRPAQLRRWHPGYGVGWLEDAASTTGSRATPATRSRVTTAYVASQRPLLTAAAPAADRDGRPRPAARLLRPARVGDGATARRRTGPGTPTGRCGSGPRAPTRSSSRTGSPAPTSTPSASSPRPARPLNTLQPGRDDRPAFEQPGCLHAGMDLYKHAFRLTPMVRSRPGRRLLRAGPRHPRARHARRAVRPRRPRLRAGADRDRRRASGVRRGAARRSPSAAPRCGPGWSRSASGCWPLRSARRSGRGPRGWGRPAGCRDRDRPTPRRHRAGCARGRTAASASFARTSTVTPGDAVKVSPATSTDSPGDSSTGTDLPRHLSRPGSAATASRRGRRTSA